MSTHIILKGKHVNIGTQVILWGDPGGFNGYDTSKVVLKEENRKTGKVKNKIIKGKRYGSWRSRKLSDISGPLIHHTGGYRASTCFNTLHNERKLSVPFILDDKGMVFQTLDAIEVAWHAGKANFNTVGIECVLRPDAKMYPDAYSDARVARLGLEPHPDTMEQVIQGMRKTVFKMPEKQLEALCKLVLGIWVGTANLFAAPKFMPDVLAGIPRFEKDWKKHQGMFLHANVSTHKWDAAGIDYVEFQRRVSTMFSKIVLEGSC